MVGHIDSVAGPAAATPAAAELPLRPRVWPSPQLDLVLRIVVLQVLVLIAFGRGTVAKGVSDGATDWILVGGERSPMRWRLLATAGCAVLGVGASAALAARPLPVSVSVGAGGLPLICFILLYRFSAVSSRTTHVGGGLAGDEGSGKSTPEAHSSAGLPLRSPIELTMLDRRPVFRRPRNSILSRSPGHPGTHSVRRPDKARTRLQPR